MREEEQKRIYKSPLRKRQLETTKEIILEGVAKVMEEEGLDQLSFDAVGQAAGVSPRTIFRHFTSRDELLAAFWSWLNQRLGITDYPSSAKELVEVVPLWFSAFGKFEKLFRAYMISHFHQEMQPSLSTMRKKNIDTCLKESVAGLSDIEALYAKAAVTVLYSGRAWATMRDVWGISSKKAGEAASWAIQIILDEMNRRQKHLKKKETIKEEEFDD